MKAIILAGGLGTRLRPITHEIPKPLITVKKEPILNHLLRFLSKHRIHEVGVLISRDHEADFARWQKAWHGELPHEKISIFVEQKPSGTFGWLKHLRDWIGQEDFILSNGDELKDFDLTKMVSFHNENRPVATIALVQVPNPSEYGVPVLDGSRIAEFLEKPADPPSNFINSGLYVLNPQIFTFADASQDFLMIEKDIFPKVAAAGKLLGFKFDRARWYDCGNLERWEKAIREW